MKAPDLARLVFLAALWGGSFIFIRTRRRFWGQSCW